MKDCVPQEAQKAQMINNRDLEGASPSVPSCGCPKACR
jgi:hypothetical protein